MSWAEQLVGVAPALLGLIHRGVGALDQIAFTAAIVRIEADAQAATDVQFMAIDPQRLGEPPHDLVGDMGRVLGTRLRQHQQEFVAPGTGHGVRRAHLGNQPPRHLAQQEIAHRMPQGIIDVLEVVQIQHHHRQPRLVALRLLNGRSQTILQQAAIGQMGQGIGIGQLRDVFFRALALGDVTDDLLIAHDPVVFNEAHAAFDGESGPVLAAMHGLVDQRTLFLQVFPQGRQSRVLVRRVQIIDAQPPQFLAGIAVLGHAAVVHREEPAVPIGQENDVVGVFAE